MPKLELSHETRKKLRKQMPGYASGLHRHEWYKHGVCVNNTTAERYYALSIGFLEEINAGPVKKLFAENIGKEITAAQIRTAFERQTERGLGNRISISCKRDSGRNLINEVRISLSNKSDNHILQENQLYKAAPSLPIGCRRGIVDPVGLQ